MKGRAKALTDMMRLPVVTLLMNRKRGYTYDTNILTTIDPQKCAKHQML